MKTIIAGSRSITSYTVVEKCIDKIVKAHSLLITEIVSGAARGVDQLGENYAIVHQIGTKRFPADWRKLGLAAGFIRNGEMARYADILICIWDGKSKGSANMIKQMESLGKPCYVEIVKL